MKPTPAQAKAIINNYEAFLADGGNSKDDYWSPENKVPWLIMGAVQVCTEIKAGPPLTAWDEIEWHKGFGMIVSELKEFLGLKCFSSLVTLIHDEPQKTLKPLYDLAAQA